MNTTARDEGPAFLRPTYPSDVIDLDTTRILLLNTFLPSCCVLNIEMAHGKDAKMLCKKIVNFFSLLSHTQETGVRRLGMTQELLSLVTGLAHYLKVLIRVALTCALTLVGFYFFSRLLLT